MIDFLRKLWRFARPYRWRLFLGVATGILAGAMAPLFIAAVTLVSTLVFQSPGQAAKPIAGVPAFFQPWLDSARAGMGSGLRASIFSPFYYWSEPSP